MDGASAIVLVGVVDRIVDTLFSDPIFAGLLAVMLLFVFFAYLFVRRTLTNLREGYDDAVRGK